MKNSSTETIIKAMHILSEDIQSDDGVANAAILEAAQRLEEQAKEIEALKAKNTDLKKLRNLYKKECVQLKKILNSRGIPFNDFHDYETWEGRK